MKPATLSKLRDELKHLPPDVVMDLLIRVIKYKKENKELLSYLLFDADDAQGFIDTVNSEIDILFKDISRRNLTLTKKTLQKIVRLLDRYAKYADSKRIEIDIRIYFCDKIKECGILNGKNATILNLYQRQIIRIKKSIDTLHPDLQYDYEEIIAKYIS